MAEANDTVVVTRPVPGRVIVDFDRIVYRIGPAVAEKGENRHCAGALFKAMSRINHPDLVRVALSVDRGTVILAMHDVYDQAVRLGAGPSHLLLPCLEFLLIAERGDGLRVVEDADLDAIRVKTDCPGAVDALLHKWRPGSRENTQ